MVLSRRCSTSSTRSRCACLRASAHCFSFCVIDSAGSFGALLYARSNHHHAERREYLSCSYSHSSMYAATFSSWKSFSRFTALSNRSIASEAVRISSNVGFSVDLPSAIARSFLVV